MTLQESENHIKGRTGGAIYWDIKMTQELANLDIILPEWYESTDQNPEHEAELRELVFRWAMHSMIPETK